jgi:hypothetical protein
MKQIIAFVFFLLLFSANLFSQNKTEDFEIKLPLQKVKNSLYKTIEFIDLRYDTTFMGIVQCGAFDRKAKVIPEMPMATQIKNVLEYLTDSSTQTDGLIFQLRQLSIKYLRQVGVVI